MVIGQVGELGVNVLERVEEAKLIGTDHAPTPHHVTEVDSATEPTRNCCRVDLDHVQVTVRF